MSKYHSACMQSSAALMSVSIGIMAFVLIINLPLQLMLILHILLAIVIWSLISIMLSSHYSLFQLEKKNPTIVNFIVFSLGILSMGFIALILVIYTFNLKIGGVLM